MIGGRWAGVFNDLLQETLVGFRGCVHSRGRVLPLAVYINDRFALGSVFELATYQPSEMYAVEVWRGGSEIRVFTQDFVRRVSRGRATLQSMPPPPPGGASR